MAAKLIGKRYELSSVLDQKLRRLGAYAQTYSNYNVTHMDYSIYQEYYSEYSINYYVG